jgi:hypothetical protein
MKTSTITVLLAFVVGFNTTAQASLKNIAEIVNKTTDYELVKRNNEHFKDVLNNGMSDNPSQSTCDEAFLSVKDSEKSINHLLGVLKDFDKSETGKQNKDQIFDILLDMKVYKIIKNKYHDIVRASCYGSNFKKASYNLWKYNEMMQLFIDTRSLNCNMPKGMAYSILEDFETLNLKKRGMDFYVAELVKSYKSFLKICK